MTTTNPAAGSASESAPRRSPNNATWFDTWIRFRLTILLVAGCLTVIAGVVYYQTATVVGIELNVANWKIRQFSYHRDPLTGKQLTGIRYSPALSYGLWTDGKEASILDPSIASYLSPDASASERWDVVSIVAGQQSSGKGHILVDLLQTDNILFGDRFWIDWTNNHTTKAKAFWPAVQKLVILDAYAHLPAAFELASSADDDDDAFKTRLDQFMVEATGEQAQLLANSGQTAQAQAVAKVGLTFGSSETLERLATQEL